MKKIFVTVAEFLENGGEIKENRKLYYFDSIENRYNQQFIAACDNPKFDDNRHHIYVQIECEPLYK